MAIWYKQGGRLDGDTTSVRPVQVTRIAAASLPAYAVDYPESGTVEVDGTPCPYWVRDILAVVGIVRVDGVAYRVRLYGSSGAAYTCATLPSFERRA